MGDILGLVGVMLGLYRDPFQALKPDVWLNDPYRSTEHLPWTARTSGMSGDIPQDKVVPKPIDSRPHPRV